MTSTNTRRGFLATSAGSCACLLAPRVLSSEPEDKPGADQPKPDFATLAYCCAVCTPERCPLYKASLLDDLEFKKKIAARWEVKLGRRVAPEEVFCFGCKAEPARQGPGVRACSVRPCVLERKVVSCAHCRELASCKKELWINYPDFRARVLRIQKDLLG